MKGLERGIFREVGEIRWEIIENRRGKFCKVVGVEVIDYTEMSVRKLSDDMIVGEGRLTWEKWGSW